MNSSVIYESKFNLMKHPGMRLTQVHKNIIMEVPAEH
jgi:hypothetical protein